MYHDFYGFRERPFALSPDPRFLYLSESHREAMAHLLFGVEQGEGFIVVTGEVGTGKTTLCRSLLQRLAPETEVAFIFNPRLSAFELLQAIHNELGLDTANRSRGELSEQLNRYLLAKKSDGRRVLLIVDEAQHLEHDTLEEIRLLSNLETDTSKLIQILLLGQPELDAILESPSLRQLRQRISVRWKLTPLSAPETREYIRHRLRIASGGRDDYFSDVALREVHRRARGIPRVVNLLCDRALLAGFADQNEQVGVSLVHGAARELEGPTAVARAARLERRRSRAGGHATPTRWPSWLRGPRLPLWSGGSSWTWLWIGVLLSGAALVVGGFSLDRNRTTLASSSGESVASSTLAEVAAAPPVEESGPAPSAPPSPRPPAYPPPPRPP